MERRKFITGLGSATAAGLAGCIDMVSSNESPNGDDDENTDNNTDEKTPDGQNPDDGSVSETPDGEYEVQTYTTAVNCASNDAEEFSSITDSSNTDTYYEFSGQMVVPNPCYETSPEVTITDGTLEVSIVVSHEPSSCDEQCPGLVNFAGAVSVSDNVTINESTVVLE